ncbi:MAG: chromate transporter [Oscillospiraceae bacterium]|nr:chromate transporter [Oscillospiraceae bacterium]
MIYLRLFFEFFKTGLFSVGGGMATIPFLEDISTRTGWFTHAQLADMVAVSESTPGPIGVNMATYVGYLTGGIPGSIIATLGLVTPSVIVILIIAAFLKSFRENKYVDRVFYGIRPASTALIASAGVSVLMLCIVDVEVFRVTGKIFELIDPKAIILFALIWVLTNLVKQTKKMHPLVFIAISAAAGLVFKF